MTIGMAYMGLESGSCFPTLITTWSTSIRYSTRSLWQTDDVATTRAVALLLTLLTGYHLETGFCEGVVGFVDR